MGEARREGRGGEARRGFSPMDIGEATGEEKMEEYEL